MIIKEFFSQREDGKRLFRTYSDEEVMIQKVNTNEIYDEAIDLESSNFQYVETDTPIPKIEFEEQEEPKED